MAWATDCLASCLGKSPHAVITLVWLRRLKVSESRFWYPIWAIVFCRAYSAAGRRPTL